MIRMRSISGYALAGLMTAAFAASAVAADWDAGAGKDWEALVAAAKKEGQVTVSVCPALTESIGRAFKQDTGIDINFITGSLAELGTKFDTEMKAGRVTTDARLAGFSALPYVSQGLLVPVRDVLLLPNVTDAANWRGGKILWLDKEQKFLPVPAEYVGAWPVINSDVVSPQSIATWDDLLKPEFKGKIAAFDPLDPIGTTTSLYLAKLKGVDFVTRLYKDAVLTRDRRQLVEWAARGTYPIVLGADAAPELESFRDAGFTSLRAVTLKDGPGNLIGGCSLLSVPVSAPHPNAARVFANWFLSKRGQEAYVAGQHQPSDRVDVGTAGVAPSLIPQPGLQYFTSWREDFLVNERPALMDQMTKALGR